MNAEDRVDKVYESLPSKVKDSDELLDILTEYSMLEYIVYYEMYDSLMDEKTGLKWEDYI